ncbi:ArpU family phage packaging/lysis transcriptional regulator [Streptococcus suis]|uniref:ArpU family phage packaging/lysis transcriptional regulator n=1 Tax=Streptococcus suis TaxID=1307 RepID=UPI0030E9C7E3
MIVAELDTKKTIEKAESTLEKYKTWRNIANDFQEQKITQQYTFEPRQSVSKPNQQVEKLALNHVEAVNELEAIEYSVSHILQPELRLILIFKYLKPYPTPREEIMKKIGYEETRYHELLNLALISFAEIYRRGALLVEKRSLGGV